MLRKGIKNWFTHTIQPSRKEYITCREKTGLSNIKNFNNN